MAKKIFCVFCGNPPKDKNKEHVIPKWLIKMTGNPNREILVGVNKDDSLRKFTINKFTLPSCESCNTDFGELELQTKPIMQSILDGNDINSYEMSILLDWFDKVRIGLWLMYFTLDKNQAKINPKFHIKKRIGQYDRALHIAKSNSKEKRINFLGVQNFSFQMTPSIFGLTINNFSFINMSHEGLTSRRMGFPFFTKKYFVFKDGQNIMRAELNKIGLQRVLLPIIRKSFLLKGSTYYQAIYNEGLIDSEESFSKIYVDNKYVIDNTLEPGKSKIISNFNKGMFYSEEDKITIPKENLYEDILDMRLDAMKQIFQLHIWLDEESLKINFDEVNKEEKKFIKSKMKYSIAESKHNLKLCNENKVQL